MERIVLLGPPAAGKGTQAEMLRAGMGFETPSVGAMLREQKAAGTPAGLHAATYFERGLLVPDEITIEVVRQWLAGRENPWVLDGFPRTIEQAEAFEAMLEEAGLGIDAAISLRVEEPVIRDRAGRRVVCGACGGIFSAGVHVTDASRPCPRCGGVLGRRADDEPETVSRRLVEYRERTECLIPRYRARGILHEFDGDRPPAEIFDEIIGVLNGRALPGRPA